MQSMNPQQSAPLPQLASASWQQRAEVNVTPRRQDRSVQQSAAVEHIDITMPHEQSVVR